MPKHASHADFIKLTVDIVSPHVANKALLSADLPKLIAAAPTTDAVTPEPLSRIIEDRDAVAY